MEDLVLLPSTFSFAYNAGMILYIEERSGAYTIYKDCVTCLSYPEISSVIESLESLFSETKIDELDFTKYDFSNVAIYNYMFARSKVKRIVGLNNSEKVKSARGMFQLCYDLELFDTSRFTKYLTIKDYDDEISSVCK